MDPDWTDLGDGELPRLVDLYQRCAAVDGGAPAAVSAPFLGRRYAGGQVVAAFGTSDGAGALIAAGSVRRAGDLATVTGVVDPAHRGRGLGAALLDRLLATGRRAAGRVVVETEALTATAQALFLSRGLRPAFAEDVLRRGLDAPLPKAPLPPEITTQEWDVARHDGFFEAYRSSFADRPGFPGWSRERWVDWTAGDDDFRPRHSLLARARDATPVGFVTCARGFLIQVGTVPRWRHRGLATALVTAALARMRTEGVTCVYLDVNVDNPASAALFRAMGFTPTVRRARFEDTPAGRPHA